MISRAQKVVETWETLIRTTKVLSSNLYQFLTLSKNVTLTWRAKHDLVETCLPTPQKSEIYLNGFQSSESDRNLGNFDPNYKSLILKHLEIFNTPKKCDIDL